MNRSSRLLLASVLALVPCFMAAPAIAAGNYCNIESGDQGLLLVRPGAGDAPIDDINWFARPVPNPGGDWIIGYAMHDLNYLYNLTTGQRIRIPDKSDAVATPDGRYMTVPSYYTPDGYVRFYDNEVLLDHLRNGKDADTVEPVFIHEHDGLKQVYYQSLGHISQSETDNGRQDVYRMIFSGTDNESGFRMADYTVTEEKGRRSFSASEPIPLCPEIANDLMTPFVSKDGQYVAAYTSPISEPRYTAGASLKVFRITDVDYDAGQSNCEEVADLGFVAGKADFSFDDNSLTFHVSNVNYLTVFVSGGEVFGPGKNADTLSTDVAVASLTRDANGIINGIDGIQRLTTEASVGSGNYFPAFLPDGNIFYISHARTERVEDRRFEIRVVDPAKAGMVRNDSANEGDVTLAAEIGKLWSARCSAGEDYQHAVHELPWLYFSLSADLCAELVNDTPDLVADTRNRLLATCERLPN
jgi:hypothetical protein